MLKIGDFSRKAKVSIKTLRYYDRVGLFKPAWKDRFSGYRYYHCNQLDELKQILALKKMGFSLEQIQTIVQEDLSPSQLRAMLTLKQTELKQEIHLFQARLKQIEAQLAQLALLTGPDSDTRVYLPVEQRTSSPQTKPQQETDLMNVKIKTKPRFTVVGLEYFGKNEHNEIKAMWDNDCGRLDTEVRHTAQTPPQEWFGVCGDLDDKGNFRYMAAVEVTEAKDLPEGMTTWEIPEQTYAVFPCTLTEIHQAYQYAHGTWMPENGYKRAEGPDFEYYDMDFQAGDPKSLLYIYIPIKK